MAESMTSNIADKRRLITAINTAMGIGMMAAKNTVKVISVTPKLLGKKMVSKPPTPADAQAPMI